MNNNFLVTATIPEVRVLLVGPVGPASRVLAAWLAESGDYAIAGPAESTAASLALAARYRPHVVLLEFHGLPISIGYLVALFKELTAESLVFVLSHEVSEAMRRRCRAAGVDAVFDKTTELPALAARLAAINPVALPTFNS